MEGGWAYRCHLGVDRVRDSLARTCVPEKENDYLACLQELDLELQTVMNEPGMVTTSTGTVREPWMTLTSTAIVERILGLPPPQDRGENHRRLQSQ